MQVHSFYSFAHNCFLQQCEYEAASLGGGFSLCAEHVQQPGGASPLPNLMEVKG